MQERKLEGGGQKDRGRQGKVGLRGWERRLEA